MTNNPAGKLICLKCNVEMEPRPQTLSYLGHSMVHDFFKCPICGQVYIPESIVKEKMRVVETNLEDK